MAVPIITRILPFGSSVDDRVEGATGGGSLVEIYGGNFRVPVPEAFKAETVPTVRVEFNGSAAPSVGVIRSNLLQVVTPPSPLPFNENRAGDNRQIGYQGVVSVTVTNLDDDGNPIPGETATATDSYLYVLPRPGDVNNPNVSVQVTDAFIEEWKRVVCSNVLTHQSVFFQANPRDIEARNIGRPELPAIVLIGPRTSEDRMYEPATQGVTAADQLGINPQEVGLFGVSSYPGVTSYAWDVLGLAPDRTSLLNLMDIATVYIRRTPRISVPRAVNNPSAGTITYDLWWEDLGTTFSVDNDPNDSDLHSFRGQVMLRGVAVDSTGLAADGLVEAVPDADSIEIDYCEPPSA